MNRLRYILICLLLLVTLGSCKRRPMEEEYLRVYLNLNIDRDITNYEVKDSEPGLMRVVFFDHYTGEYLSHDFVSDKGGYVFAPYGNVDMLVYNIEAGETRIRNYYSHNDIEAYTNEINDIQRSRFTRYLQSRVDVRPSYDLICVTPGHLFVARENDIYIPRHITDEVLILTATARTIVESWTVEVEGITGMQYVGSVSMMLSGQVASSFIATDRDSFNSIALYFDVVSSRKEESISSRFETFGRERTSGDTALLSILFTDVQGHPYMYNFDVSSQMEDNPEQHIKIKANINIPKPEVGGGFKPEVDDWKEHRYDIDI